MPTTTIHFVRHGKVYNPDHLLYERLPVLVDIRGILYIHNVDKEAWPMPSYGDLIFEV